MSKRLIVSAVFVGLLVGTVYWYGRAIVCECLDSANYSPDYTERAFQSVREGMTQEDVTQLLGPPLRTTAHTPEVIRWYGPPGTTVSDEGGLNVPDGANPALSAIITYDPSGQQALHPAAFVGLSVEMIQNTLGEPIKEESRLAVSYWHYSMSEGHYHRRWIGFDAEGKVVEKIAYFYWD